MRDLRVLITRPSHRPVEWKTQVSKEIYGKIKAGDQYVQDQVCQAAKMFTGIPFASRCIFTLFV